MNFKELQRIMPGLIGEMAADVTLDAESEMDEFVILSHEGDVFDGDIPRFVYYKSDHPDLLNHISVLVNEGFVSTVSDGSPPIYRMKKGFRSLLVSAQKP
ncbi:MAG: hypothetical protein GWN30_27365 [Gammaproteobacteria bacterium]|nr:hypothetical protein [Gammaproteobacteria bacterium]